MPELLAEPVKTLILCRLNTEYCRNSSQPITNVIIFFSKVTEALQAQFWQQQINGLSLRTQQLQTLFLQKTKLFVTLTQKKDWNVKAYIL